MKTLDFNLPDLGEGLAEAEIRQWYVSEGDTIGVDEPMVSVETAKAVVDIPSPVAGQLVKCFGKAGDIIKTGEPLAKFKTTDVKSSNDGDQGTVVGSLQSGDTVIKESPTGVKPTSTDASSKEKIKAAPAVRALAKKLNVALEHVTSSQANGVITANDVKQAAETTQKEEATQKGEMPQKTNKTVTSILEADQGAERASSGVYNDIHEQRSELRNTEMPQKTKLQGVRRYMAVTLSEAHESVVPVTLMDDANISAWTDKEDISLRIIRAILKACKKEPALNAHFCGKALARTLFDTVNLGIALDTKAGLYVPVVKNAAHQTDEKLRKQIEHFKTLAAKQTFTPDLLRDATLVLSNFGSIGGRYATPMIVPPTVAIIGVGAAYDGIVAENNKPVVQRCLPISLTVDHRAVTGGEAARFLKILLSELQ